MEAQKETEGHEERTRSSGSRSWSGLSPNLGGRGCKHRKTLGPNCDSAGQCGQWKWVGAGGAMIYCSLRTDTLFKDWLTFQEVTCMLFFQRAVV